MVTTKYFTVFGSHAAGDIWQFGFYGSHDGDDGDAAGAVATEFATHYFTGTGCPFPVAVTMRGATCAQIDEATGHLQPKTQAAHAQAGSIASSLPPEVAVCVSLFGITGIRGRFYLPPLGANQVDVNGFIDGGAQAWLRDHLDTIWSNLGGRSSPIRINVYSRKTHTMTAASRYSIGSVFDSQRRRRNKIAESKLGNNFPS